MLYIYIYIYTHTSGRFPTNLRIPPLKINIMLDSMRVVQSASAFFGIGSGMPDMFEAPPIERKVSYTGHIHLNKDFNPTVIYKCPLEPLREFSSS